jgi:GGDEF domain-containing protein
VGRLGGDEFVVLVESRAEEATTRAEDRAELGANLSAPVS